MNKTNKSDTLKKVSALIERGATEGERQAALEASKRLAEAHHLVRTHPNCTDCCAVGRCHWCLARPQSGTLSEQGEDGFTYAACTTHLQYFREAQHHAQPHAGLDLTQGLAHLEISQISPLHR